MTSPIIPPYTKPTNYTYYADDVNFSAGKNIEFPDGDDILWNTFFTGYVKITENDYNDNKIYYTNLFKSYYEKFFVKKTNKGYTVPEIQSANEHWKYFLNNSDLHKRQNAPFLWAFSILLQIIPEMQDFSKSESSRVLFLSNVQKAAIDKLGTPALSLIPVSSSSDHEDIRSNTKRMSEMQVIMGRKGLASGYSQKASKQLDGANSANEAINSLMGSLLQNVRDVLNRLIQ